MTVIPNDRIAAILEDGFALYEALRRAGYSFVLTEGGDLVPYAKSGRPTRIVGPLGIAFGRNVELLAIVHFAMIEAFAAISRAKSNSRRAPKRQKHKSEVQR